MKNDGMFVVLMILLGVYTGGFGILILLFMWMFDSNTSSTPSYMVREVEVYMEEPILKVLPKSFSKEHDNNGGIELLREAAKRKRIYESNISRPNLLGIGSEYKCPEGTYMFTGGNPALVPFIDVPDLFKVIS
jgi:hypothetical protein